VPAAGGRGDGISQMPPALQADARFAENGANRFLLRLLLQTRDSPAIFFPRRELHAAPPGKPTPVLSDLPHHGRQPLFRNPVYLPAPRRSVAKSIPPGRTVSRRT